MLNATIKEVNDKKLVGILHVQKDQVILQYVDDTSLVLEVKERAIGRIIHISKRFMIAFRMVINWTNFVALLYQNGRELD